ncbi:type II toxin-antitoxin system prevent-host-death family antitoxin [Bdellovibrionota bacterium FG-1]
MSGYKRQSVGIKELKDHASEIIATVQRTGRAISITKSSHEVARIVPISVDPYERLVASGLVKPGQKPRPLSELRLKVLASDSSDAIRAILQDREEHE